MNWSITATIGSLIQSGALVMSDGYRTKRSELGEEGFRIVRAADIVDGTVRLDAPDFVRREFAGMIGVKSARAGDVVLTTKGTVGRVAIVPEISEQVVYSPQLCFFRVAPNETLDARFLRFWFDSAEFRHQASHRMNNSDMAPDINLADIRSLRLTLPPFIEQRAIAEVLGALDDKIAANTRLVDASEALASAVFDSLSPMRAEPLTRLARFINGKAFTKGATGTGRVVIRIAELNSGVGGSTVYNDIDVPDENLARPGDLLFAWSGSLTVRRWYRPEGIINQHIFKVIPRSPHPIWLVHQILLRRLDDFQLIAADKATTMGHIQRRHLEEPVPVPTEEAAARADPVMVTLWKTALSAEQETLVMAELRDTLLPQLMSGKLRVRHAEKQVGAVV
jgi:type I restriction enzyme S subunit